MPRVALYCRVSTIEQHVEPQLYALRSYADARGLTIAAEYVDHGVSGAKDRRPALDRLLADCRTRQVDAVAVTKLDRLGRSLRHLLILVGELEALGIDFISLDDSLDTSTPVGRLFFQIRGAFAEYERSLIAERAAAGRAAAKRRGVQFGRRSTLPLESAARVGRLHSSGHSVREIAKLLGIGKDVVHREIVRLRAVAVTEPAVSKVPKQIAGPTAQKSATYLGPNRPPVVSQNPGDLRHVEAGGPPPI